MSNSICQNCDSNPVAKGARGQLLKYCSQECRNQYRFKKGRLARASAVGLVEKCCRKCGETLPRESFHQDGKRVDGLYPWCKSCRRTYMGSQPKRTPKFRTKAEYDVDYLGKMTAATRDAKVRRSYLWATYRMTPEDYDALLSAQGGCCAICRTDHPGVSSSKFRNDNQRFSVDHDHSCCPGKMSCGSCVRGLLCRNCNVGIGSLRDDPQIITAALEYLSKSDKLDVQPLLFG